MNTTFGSIESAARHLVANKLTQGFIIEALHTYTDTQDNPLYWRIRLKHPQTAEKIIWPFHQNMEGNFVLKEPSFSDKKPLYKLHELAKHNSDPVWIVEGELCADKLEALGLTVTTSGGSGSAAMADWSPLKNRSIIIWPDNDEAGLNYARQVTQQLKSLDCSIQQIDIAQLGLASKADCMDWLRANPIATASDIQALALLEACSEESANKSNLAQYGSNKSSHLLLELIKQFELFHDEQGQGYASFHHKGKLETMLIYSNSFKNCLSQQYWEKLNKPAPESTLQEVISILNNKAQFEGKRYTLFTRVGHSDKNIYLNLSNEQKQVIEITPNGWKILNSSPIKFIQHSSMKALPLPEKEGNIDLLWQHLNIDEEDRKLILSWILDCWIPYTHFPILVLTGLQGSAKSTTQEILRKIIDPNICSLRNAPRNSDDIPIAAANSWLVSYNNISKLSQQYQDDLCCLSTGGGFAKRKLFSNSEETAINVKRPTILNGIINPITSQDLISRSLIIELPNINDRQRKSESELRHSFKLDHPKIFGALLNLLVAVLKEKPNTQLDEKPRMSDFALLGTTLEKILGWPTGSFLESHKINYQTSMLFEIEGSPVAGAIMKLIHHQHQFKGTFAELYELISTPYYKPDNATWPHSPKGLANILKREIAALEIANIKIIFDSHRTRNGYLIEITQKSL